MLLLLLLCSDILAHVKAVSNWSQYFKTSSSAHSSSSSSDGGRGNNFDSTEQYQDGVSSGIERSTGSQNSAVSSFERIYTSKLMELAKARPNTASSSSSSACVKLSAASEAGILAMDELGNRKRLSFSRSRIQSSNQHVSSVASKNIYSGLFDLARECSEECKGSSNVGSGVDVCNTVPRGGALAEQVASVDAVSNALGRWGVSLKGWKIIFQIFLTTLNILCWLLPLRAKKFSENKKALSLANAFSGGVFLSLAFGHLIPECVHGFEGYNEALPYMSVLGGYIIIFFVEKVAFDAHGILHEMEDNEEVDLANGSGAISKQMESHYSPSGRSALILLGALAVHSILEMTVMGMASTFEDCALLTFSIGIHQVCFPFSNYFVFLITYQLLLIFFATKPAESLALLVAFLKSGMRKKDIIFFLSIFSCFGPIGCFLGMILNEFATPIVDAFMLATVAGTFIYVGATEVIPEEWEDGENKWTKFGLLLAGICSIFTITQYTNTIEHSIMS